MHEGIRDILENNYGTVQVQRNAGVIDFFGLVDTFTY